MCTTRQIVRAVASLLALSAAACGGREADRPTDSAAPSSPATAAAPANADEAEDRVEVALDADSGLRAFGLDADDDDGKIVLKGKVASDAQRAMAEQVASRTAPGVTIENRIRVEAGSGAKQPADVDEAEDRVEDALKADSTLRALDLDADEENGQIVLEGTARTAAQKTLAEQVAARTAPGVTIVNRIRVQ